MMRILQINCVYGTGSTGKITQSIHHALLAEGHTSYVLYGRGSASDAPGTIKTGGEVYAKANRLGCALTGFRYGGCAVETRRISQMIRRLQPDLVHLQCINGNFVNIYRLTDWLKNSGLPVVLTLHAEFPYTANCSSSMDCERWRHGCGDCPRRYAATKSLMLDRSRASYSRMRKAYEGFGDRLTVVSVSPWLRERAEASSMLGDFRHMVILNGVDIDVFRPDAGVPAEDRKTVLHVTAAFSDEEGHAKGGHAVLELAKRFKDEAVTFLVAGDVEQVGAIPDNVQLLGRVTNAAELASLYASSNASLITSRQETFSMPVAESLCCGTPVVGYRAGGPERIALQEGSEFVPQGDLDALEAALRKTLGAPYDRAELAFCAAMQYSERRMCQEYLELYRSISCN